MLRQVSMPRQVSMLRQGWKLIIPVHPIRTLKMFRLFKGDVVFEDPVNVPRNEWRYATARPMLYYRQRGRHANWRPN